MPPTTEALAPTAPVPPETAPEALPFSAVLAVNDSLGVSSDQVVLDVLGNDSFGTDPRLVSVTQPAIGAAEIVDGDLVVSLPPSFAGDISFTYTISDESGVQSTATVEVFSVNVLAPAGERIDAESAPAQSPSEVLDRIGSLFTGLVQIQLTPLQLTTLAFGPLLLGLVRLLFVRRDELLSVTSTARTSDVGLVADDDVFKLRHNALVWSTNTNRMQSNKGGKTRIDLPNGDQTWIDSDRIVDTGY